MLYAGVNATALTAGSSHNCALRVGGSVSCWGFNGFGGLGIGSINNVGESAGQMGNSLQSVNLGTGKPSCWCHHSTRFGTTHSRSAGYTAIAVSAGNQHTCVLRNDYSVVCFGLNNNGQLGIGSSVSIGTSTAQMGNNLKAVNLGTGSPLSSLQNCSVAC